MHAPEKAQPLGRLTELPLFAPLFVWRNLGAFRKWFLALTFVSFCASGLTFFNVYLLSEVVSKAAALNAHDIWSFYLPVYFFCYFFKEGLDYLTRRYGEMFPTMFREHALLRAYVSVLKLPPQRLFNYSKERLNALLSAYFGNVEQFLIDWFWNTSRRLVTLVIIFCVLWHQSRLVFTLNAAYLIGFLLFAFQLSARFIRFQKAFAIQSIETNTLLQSFLISLNTLRRLGATDFFEKKSSEMLGRHWDRLGELRAFHAKRWWYQLHLFNLLSVGTLFYGVFQVIEGKLPVGYLILLKFSFDQLWQIIVQTIEYYVNLLRQREDAKLLRAAFEEIGESTDSIQEWPFSQGFKEIELRNVQAEFKRGADLPPIVIRVPELKIKRGERIGILGPSGIGKSTVLNILAGLLDYEGEYLIDARRMRGVEFAPGEISFISSYDPLFYMTVRDNILLGRNVSNFEDVMQGTTAASFSAKLDQRMGEAATHLSTGQEQRVRLARGVVQLGELVLLDEPFRGLDRHTREQVMAYLNEALKNKTVVLVTHDPEELALVQRVYEIKDGVLGIKE